MAHSHHHASPTGHNHSHAESSNLALAFWLNFGFSLIEIVGGVLTNSVAIIADAVHDLGDSLAIGFAWIAGKTATKKPNQRFSYGYRRWSLFSALVTGVILLLGSAWVLSEAIPRFWHPQLPHTSGMLMLAVLGIAVNGYAVWRLKSASTQNEKMISWHLLEDLLGWVAVLVGAIIMKLTGWAWIDPLLSIVVTVFITYNVVKSLQQTILLFLQVSPDVNAQLNISNKLQQLDFVQAIHHLHLWSLDGERHVLTMHIVIGNEVSPELQLQYKQQIKQILAPFNLSHTTVEFELSSETCRDKAVPDEHRHVH